MVLGTLGSTLNDELNRLANGGTYRDSSAMVDEALAAKQWANRENISPYTTDTVGVLNEIAGLGTNRQNWLDFNGVCNYIAGTSGLPAAAALRQIYPTTDLLTGVASYYVDANEFNTPGYVYLSGASGNYISVPDSNDLDTVGDIDIRVCMGLTSWASGAEQRIVSKFTVGQGSYSYGLLSDGTLRFTWYSDGTISFAATSTVSVPFNAGQNGWVRVTLDVDNGASGNTATFFTSTDGVTWTVLGTPVVQAFIAVIFAGTANIGIGANSSGAAVLATGKFYQVQILNGINGTAVLNANMTGVSQSATSFLDSTGKTVSINGARQTAQDVTNLGAAGSLLPTTVGSSTAADSNDPIFLAHTGTNYVYTPGVNGNYLSVPDADNLDIVGDMDVRVQVAMDDWTPSSDTALMAKWAGGGSWILRLQTNGTLVLLWRESGGTTLTKASTASVSATDGTVKWVRATLDVDNGASGNDVKFFTSDNGTAWTQLGTTVTTAGVTNIAVSTFAIQVGIYDNGFGQPAAAKFYRAQIYSDITGTTKVLDVDTSVITAGSATSFTAVTGQTVTINRSTSGRKTVAVTQPTWLFGTDDYMEVNNRYMAHSTAAENYVYLSGASGNYMSVADNPPLDVTGDIDLQVKVALDDWTPASGAYLVGKLTSASSQVSYAMRVSAAGNFVFLWSTNGTTLLTATSTAANTITDGTTKWVRTTVDVDNGASGYDVKFWTSDDAVTWTQLGSTVTGAGVTSLYSGTAILEIGSGAVGTLQPAKGKFFRAIIKNGIDGTVVLDADASVITLPSQTTFVDRSSNAYTVTINKSGVGTFVSTGNYLYLPGIATNYASAPDSAALDITGNIDLRVKVALDDWTPSATQVLIGKRASGQYSYQLSVLSTGIISMAWTTDGSTTVTALSTVAPTIADGETLWIRATLSVASNYTVIFYTSTDGITWTQLGTTVTGVGATSIFSGTSPIEVGSVNGGTSTARGKFFRAQVLNGINGTVAFDANFESSITSLLQTSFTESSTNGATVTINRSGSTFRSAGVIDAGYLYPGATNTFSNSTTDFLNFGDNQDFTVLAFVRTANNPSSNQQVLGKGNYGGNLSYVFASVNTGFNGSIQRDGGNYYYSSVVSTTTPTTLLMIRSGSSVVSYANKNALVPPSQAGDLSRSIANIIATFRIGRLAETATGYADMEFFAGAIFRSALTAAQIRQVTNYFTNREAYL